MIVPFALATSGLSVGLLGRTTTRNMIVPFALLLLATPGLSVGLPNVKLFARRLIKPPSALYASAGATETPPIDEQREVDTEQLIIDESIIDREDTPGITPRELKDQTRESIEYFASERVPSALIAGATLGVLFAYPLAQTDAPLRALSKRIYMLLATGSLCNTLLSVFSSSLAIVRLLGHEHEPMAKDPLVMMLREVPLFFLAVRAHYLTGLLLFVAALTVRIFTDYAQGSPTFAKALVCLVGSTLSFMLAMYNTHLVSAPTARAAKPRASRRRALTPPLRRAVRTAPRRSISPRTATSGSSTSASSSRGCATARPRSASPPGRSPLPPSCCSSPRSSSWPRPPSSSSSSPRRMSHQLERASEHRRLSASTLVYHIVRSCCMFRFVAAVRSLLPSPAATP